MLLVPPLASGTGWVMVTSPCTVLLDPKIKSRLQSWAVGASCDLCPYVLDFSKAGLPSCPPTVPAQPFAGVPSSVSSRPQTQAHWQMTAL